MHKDFFLLKNYISLKDHDALILESTSVLRKASWNKDHFDSVIKNFKEITLGPVSLSRFPHIAGLYNRIKKDFFSGKQMQDPHILKLASDGYILPHVDHVAYLIK